MPRARRVAAVPLALCAVLCLWPRPACAAEHQGTASLLHYTSEIDGTRQQYGAFVPAAGPPRPEGYPVCLHYHGYGWSVSADFSDFQKRWACDHGCIVANVNGRGPTFYDGIGENDVFRVLQDLDGRFGIDDRRVYATGGSMGGTGAYRQGVRWPDSFAAVVGVDGWSDFRLISWHWYGPTYAPSGIEEFRRPLLEAIGTSYIAPRARTGNIGLVTDLLDTVVWPGEGQLLDESLDIFQRESPHEYLHSATENPNIGHGGGFRIEDIYRYFLDRTSLERPAGIRVVTTQLKYGSLHWATIEEFVQPGVRADLVVDASGSSVMVQATNVATFALDLPNSPVPQQEPVTIVVNDEQAYAGRAGVVTLALADPRDPGSGWRRASDAPALRKTAALEGPIGHAFTKPFVLAYGTVGTADETRQNREEAEQFAESWTRYYVHYPAVRAVRDTGVLPDQIRGASLVLFGTEESNGLLRDAAARTTLPVRVSREGIRVQDPRYGDRDYRGSGFGAFFVYPNPLSAFRTYLVVAHGRYPTLPDGQRPQGLGYDLEKLPWTWPDYVVFNGDPAKLPYVGNINDKAEVLCYETGYSVEAGYFDQRWQPMRDMELGWVNQDPDAGAARRLHVGELAVDARREGAGWTGEAALRVVDELDAPIEAVRVAVGWSGTVAHADAGVTDADGWVRFRCGPVAALSGAFTCRVLSMIGIDATYDWRLNVRHQASRGFGHSRDVAVWFHSTLEAVRPGLVQRVDLGVANHGDRSAEAMVGLSAGGGEVDPQAQTVRLAAGESRAITFWWSTDGLEPGQVRLRARAELQEGADPVPDDNEQERVVLLSL